MLKEMVETIKATITIIMKETKVVAVVGETKAISLKITTTIIIILELVVWQVT